jgi:hypothetical protein
VRRKLVSPNLNASFDLAERLAAERATCWASPERKADEIKTAPGRTPHRDAALEDVCPPGKS